jgi:hypothetical protein
MLRYPLLITALALGCTAAVAEEKEVRHSWCQGYIVKALSEFPIEGLSRTQLWLGWNVVSQHGIAQGGIKKEEYTAGRAQFDSLFSASDSQRIISMNEEECALGRNKSGWFGRNLSW